MKYQNICKIHKKIPYHTHKLHNMATTLLQQTIEQVEEYNQMMKIIEENGPKLVEDDDEEEESMEAIYDELGRKDHFQNTFSWAYPSKQAQDEICDFVNTQNDTTESQKILEVGSGQGLWAKLLNLRNLNVTATDNFSSHCNFEQMFSHVENLSADQAVAKYNDHQILMLIWPPYAKPMAYQTLLKFKGDKVIYIGEGNGGCTADNYFHKELDDNWELVKYVDIPTWYCLRDSLFLYKRK